jgi:hypothetical protein
VLHAGEVDGSARCGAEAWDVTIKTGLAVAANLAYQGAKGLTVAALAAYALAVDEGVLAGPVLAQLYAAWQARILTEQSLYLAFLTATAAAMEAGKALGACLTSKPDDNGPPPGDGPACKVGSSEVCDWSLWITSDTIHYEQDNCTCERTGMI